MADGTKPLEAWSRRRWLATMGTVAATSMGAASGTGVAATASSPTSPASLPSWRDGPTRDAVRKLLAQVTQEGSSAHVPVADRHAVFALDGALMPERPSGVFLQLRTALGNAMRTRPELIGQPDVQALLSGDLSWFASRGGARTAWELMADLHEGLSVDRMVFEVAQFLELAEHPTLKRPFRSVAYPPMLELLSALREAQFTCWLVTTGPMAYARGVGGAMFGMRAPQCIGSRLATRLDLSLERSRLVYTGRLESVNDREQRPAHIDLHLGQRPVLAVGSIGSASDLAMLRYSQERNGPSLQCLVHHDDAEREFAYDEADGASLGMARRYGFQVISMRRDWASVFAPVAGG